MRLAILTTQTPHHAYFLRKLAEAYPVGLVLSEQQGAVAGFDTAHPFEVARDAFEVERFFAGNKSALDAYAPVVEVETVNSPAAVSTLEAFDPEAVIVFGTGLIKGDMLARCPQNTFNLHGGDPERYRGLDSHLWAIYHNDFGALSTTIHRLNSSLDDGEIVLEEQLPLYGGMGLAELRAVNTEACVRLTVGTLDMVSRFGSTVSRPQRRAGRYYSFMPSCLKDICVDRFAQYIGGLS